MPAQTSANVSSFTRKQEAHEEAKRVKLTPIATSEFIAWLERNDHARGVALHCINDDTRTDDQKAAHLKSIMGHGHQGRYIQWDEVIGWLKVRAEQDAQAAYDENESLRLAERGGAGYLGWDYTDEERVMIQMAAEAPRPFAVGDTVIDDTGFSGTVIQVDKANPEQVEIEYFVRRERWAYVDSLTPTQKPQPPISVNDLMQAYQSCVGIAETTNSVLTLKIAHEQLVKDLARILKPYMAE